MNLDEFSKQLEVTSDDRLVGYRNKNGVKTETSYPASMIGRVMSKRHCFISGTANLVQNNDAVNGLTFRVAHSFLSPPTAVRLMFYNYLTTPLTFAQHWMSTARVINATLSPAASSEWFVGGQVVVPAAIDSANSRPSLVYGPWINVYPQESIADPGTFPVMAHVLLQPANATYNANYEDVSWREAEPKSSGMYWACRQQSGSDTAANPGLFSDVNVRLRSPIWGMEAMCADGSVTVADFGDSIMAGAGQVPYGVSDVYQAIKAINIAGTRKVGYMRCGFGGQNSAGYSSRCLDALSTLRPDILILSAGTPNDGVPSLSGQRDNRARILQCIELARSLNIKIILRGWAPHSVVADNWPQGTLTTTPTYPVATVAGDVYRKDQNARSLAMDGQNGVTYIPGPSALGDGAVPERYLVQYTDDTNHPNAAGYTLIAPATRAGIERDLVSFK